MMNYGASIKEEKEWHKVNAIVKMLWAFIWPLILLVENHSIIFCGVVFVLLLLIEWAFFDIVLSKMLHGSYWYLGKTSAIDKRFRTFFGVHEGLIKFLICSIVILLINFFL